MNLTALDAYTRDLTGIFSTDVVTSTLMTRFINEGYKELARRQGWPWLVGGTVTPLSAGTDVPVFDEEFHAVLAYRAAVKVLAFVSDDTPRAQTYLEEYNALVRDMESQYLSGLATGVSANLTQLTRLVRDVTAIYDNDAISDAMIKIYINNAYNELARAREWDWLEATLDTAMPAWTSNVHTINLSNGTRRVLEAYVADDSGYIEEMVGVPSLLDIEPVEDHIKYDVTADGVFRFKPQQEANYTVRIRYLQSWTTLGDSDAPLFAPQFRMILVYRAAMMVLGQLQPDDPRVAVFDAEYGALLDGMVKHYELDHDSRPIQFNADGIETRKYFPWFKPV
jgi:hypothetical protein